VEAGTVIKLDWSEVKIVAGGEAYYESYTTENDVVGKKMFYKCSKLQQMVLPTSVTIIGVSAFDLMGRKVKTLQPGTIYIRKGKKFMITQ